jgi:hypothetical protein
VRCPWREGQHPSARILEEEEEEEEEEEFGPHELGPRSAAKRARPVLCQ